jgi:hypothetical protein
MSPSLTNARPVRQRGHDFHNFSVPEDQDFSCPAGANGIVLQTPDRSCRASVPGRSLLLTSPRYCSFERLFPPVSIVKKDLLGVTAEEVSKPWSLEELIHAFARR